jgi:hypothetical protein
VVPQGLKEDTSMKVMITQFGQTVECECDFGPYATASTSIKGAKQAPDEIFIKTWFDNEGLLEQLIAQNIVAAPHRFIPAGFDLASVCRLKT